MIEAYSVWASVRPSASKTTVTRSPISLKIGERDERISTVAISCVIAWTRRCRTEARIGSAVVSALMRRGCRATVASGRQVRQPLADGAGGRRWRRGSSRRCRNMSETVAQGPSVAAGVSYDYAGKVVLVTGAARGMGRDLVQRFALAGAGVMASDVAPTPSRVSSTRRGRRTTWPRRSRRRGATAERSRRSRATCASRQRWHGWSTRPSRASGGSTSSSRTRASTPERR